MSIFSKLGKSLKKTLRPLVGVAAPILGGAIGGPLGASIGKTIGGALSRPRSSAMTAALPSMQTALPALALPALGTAARILPGIGRSVGTIAKLPAVRAAGRLARDVGTVVVGGLIIDSMTGQVIGRKRSRRINPLNPKAARRAIRRIKSVRKICLDIERSLPRQRQSRACPPFTRTRKKRC